MELDARTQPHSLEAERSVLGSMLLDENAVTLAMETLAGEDFYSPAHKEIFEAMQSLVAGAKPVDVVTLADALYNRGSMEGVGGIAYIAELSRYVPATVNVKSYVNIVEEKSTLRKLIRASGLIGGESYEGSLPTPEILDRAERRIFDISQKRTGADTLVHINPLLISALARIEQLVLNKGQIDGVPSGFTDLDRLTTGFHPGELILVGARPAMGKTAFMLNIAQYAAMRHKKTVAYFSLEMPREQLTNRILCSEAMVDMQAVRQGNLQEDDWEKLARAMSPLAASPIYMDDTSSITIPEMRSRCRRMQIERGLDLVVIDYLQLMNASGRADNRQGEISEISRQLKILSQELKVPIVVGSQLSRALENRPNHRPVLSDLRDSGAIEQDADVVMFLYRDDYYNPETEDKGIAEVILSKQRNGPLGTVRLAYIDRYTRFVNMES